MFVLHVLALVPMRARTPFLSFVCVLGALLSACASTPTAEQIKTTFDAGLKDYDSGDYAAAYQKWKTINDIDVAAMRNTAVMLRKGQGVPKNPKAAQDKMEQAADAGLVTAQADLGDMLLNGEVGPPDPKAAAAWLALAAQAGHPVAAFQLGELYEQGTGVKQDIETARKLYQQAAAAGVKDAEERLKTLPPALKGTHSSAAGT
jgi:uncharacterized protein